MRTLRRIRVWARDRGKAAEFAAPRARARIAIETAATVHEAVAGADIICTVTKAREPILLGEWLAAGVHLNVVGSSIAAAAEIDTPAVVKSRFFVDYRESTVNEGGEYLRALARGAITPEHILAEIGEVANGPRWAGVAARRDTVQVPGHRAAGPRLGALCAREGARGRRGADHRLLASAAQYSTLCTQSQQPTAIGLTACLALCASAARADAVGLRTIAVDATVPIGALRPLSASTAHQPPSSGAKQRGEAGRGCRRRRRGVLSRRASTWCAFPMRLGREISTPFFPI